MAKSKPVVALVLGCLMTITYACHTMASDQKGAPLPEGVRAVWNLEKAWRETTDTRERVCLNGLWRWQPIQKSDGESESPPKGNWGWFKVPALWRGGSDYLRKDCHTVHIHEAWKECRINTVTAAWYERTMTVPKNWGGRRITIYAEYINSAAQVFIDNKPAGYVQFPADELDVTKFVKPGATHTLNMRVVAVPLQKTIQDFTDSNAPKAGNAKVFRRGLCGDVFLVSTPAQARLAGLRLHPSVRNGTLTIEATLDDLKEGKAYTLSARVLEKGKPVTTLASNPFTLADLKGGAFTYSSKWMPEKLWDLHMPENMYELEMTLREGEQVVDVDAPQRFGFRELWIEKRDFILNGKRVFWSCVPFDNAQVNAIAASYEGARESMRRLKSMGINMVYTHNYGCKPGDHLSFSEILRAADDEGMLMALSTPHPSHYNWDGDEAGLKNGYSEHADFYTRVAGMHPSVIAYSSSHNACGYFGDQDPDKIDGLYNKRSAWAMNHVRKARYAEAALNRLDPSRIVYHHSSGNLGTMHTSNFYLNFVPIQECSDWFEHWATKGVKPVFMVEYGVPFAWDWTMYRGWYKGKRTFGSALVPWEYCSAEWNAQFLGDEAYRCGESEKANIRWEANKFNKGEKWHRWDYPVYVGANKPDLNDQARVHAMYLKDNWRAHRTWGVSGTSPWQHNVLFRLKPTANTKPRTYKTDWDNLQRPGYSPDAIDDYFTRRDMAFEVNDWEATSAGEAVLRNNQLVLAYIGGRQGAFTEKGHNFRAGETVEKQFILINNSRETLATKCEWTFQLPTAVSGKQSFELATGSIFKHPVEFDLPTDLKPGAYPVKLTVSIGKHGTQEDTFVIDVLPAARPQVKAGPGDGVAVFDPEGATSKLLTALGVACAPVAVDQDLSAYEVLVIGRRALKKDGPGPDLSRVREGLRVVIFEQEADVLEHRLGFRVQEYGLRKVFVRTPGHAILAGLGEANLHDWQGEATLVPPRAKYLPSNDYKGAHVEKRNGLVVPRGWRCGTRGNVASVLIEKPATGDFHALVDGGFSLQYSPLLVYREGKGGIVFCQMDVTGRLMADPAAERLAANLLSYVQDWKAPQRRSVVYAGEPAGSKHLVRAGFAPTPFAGTLKPDQLLVVGPGGQAALAKHKDAVGSAVEQGARVLALGLDGKALKSFLPLNVTTKSAEHLNAVFEAPPADSPLAGIGPANIHNRDPRKLPLVTGGAKPLGNGVLATAMDGRVVCAQMCPWSFKVAQQNTKKVFKQTSVLLARVLGNLDARAETPLIERIRKGGAIAYYLDPIEDWDDPYRFFRW